MGSNAWDGWVEALSGQQIEPRAAQLGVDRNVQPSGLIAHGTEFLSAPIADRAFCSAWAQAGPGAAGQRGGIILGQSTTGPSAFVRDQIGAWFWYTPSASSVAGDIDVHEHIAILPIGNITLVSIGTFNRTDMSSQPGRLSAHPVITSTPLGALLTLTGWHGVGFGADRGTRGPFYKPPGLVVFVSGPTLQRSTFGTFTWIELPNPRT